MLWPPAEGINLPPELPVMHEDARNFDLEGKDTIPIFNMERKETISKPATGQPPTSEGSSKLNVPTNSTTTVDSSSASLNNSNGITTDTILERKELTGATGGSGITTVSQRKPQK